MPGRPIDSLIHHSDRGSQYVSIRYTERLAEAGVEPSVGSLGDSNDNALAESVIGLFKTEIIHRLGPWKSFEAVEYKVVQPPAPAEIARETEGLSVVRLGRFGSIGSHCYVCDISV